MKSIVVDCLQKPNRLEDTIHPKRKSSTGISMDEAYDNRDIFGIPFYDPEHTKEEVGKGHPMLRMGASNFDDDDVNWALQANHRITWYGIGPVAAIGIILNCLTLWVWGSRRGDFNAVVFLFKALAVFDIIYIVMFNVWWYSPMDSQTAFVFKSIAFGTQSMSVNTTLLLDICRWTAVYRPLLTCRLFSPFRTRLALGIIMGYCFLFRLVERIVAATVSDMQVNTVISVVVANVVMSIPLLLMAVLSISMLWWLFFAPRVSPELSSTNHVHRDCGPHDEDQSLTSKARPLTYVVLCITLTTFVSYPVGQFAVGYFQLTPDKTQASAKRILIACINLLRVINSSVNFLFYLLFLWSFRKLLMKKLFENTGEYHSLANTSVSQGKASSLLNMESSSASPQDSRRESQRRQSSNAAMVTVGKANMGSPTVLVVAAQEGDAALSVIEEARESSNSSKSVI